MQRRSTALCLALSFVAFAYPVLKSPSAKDPLAGRWTDHQRYRYCSALVLRNPLHALTTPLEELYAEDQGDDRVVTWGKEPCHEGGIVHVLLHAPFYWVIEAKLLTQVGSTHAYVLFLLAVAHLTVWLLLAGPWWWTGLLLYPFLLRCALDGLQEPVAFLLAVVSARSWRDKRYAVALVFAVLAFSAYSRWVFWILPLVWLGWRKRAAVIADLKTQALRRPLISVCVAACFAWSCVAFVLAALHRPPPGSGVDLTSQLAVWSLIVLWGLHWWRNRDSLLAPFVVIGLLFISLYNGWVMFWYVAPLLAAAPLIATPAEAVLWSIPAIVGADLLLNREMTVRVGDLARFAVEAWRALL